MTPLAPPALLFQLRINESDSLSARENDAAGFGGQGAGPPAGSAASGSISSSLESLQRGSLRSLVAHSTARVKASTASLALRALRTLSLAVNYNHLVCKWLRESFNLLMLPSHFQVMPGRT